MGLRPGALVSTNLEEKAVSDEQENTAPQEPEQPAVVDTPPVAEPEAAPAAEPPVESGSVTAEEADAAGAQQGTGQQLPETEQPADEPDAAGGGKDEGAPAEGYDPDKQVFVKQFNLSSSTALHTLNADALAEHPQTAALPDAAARAALDQGYKPTGPAELVHAEPDGAKSALSFAVPVEPRPAPTPPSGPAPFKPRPGETGAASEPGEQHTPQDAQDPAAAEA
jgi:hypothetical protein